MFPFSGSRAEVYLQKIIENSSLKEIIVSNGKLMYNILINCGSLKIKLGNKAMLLLVLKTLFLSLYPFHLWRFI